ncbi:uncharacterized protein L201_006418 [Kwoniella dendrophila CBS 6074]|uniref:Two-component system sensor protein n=1 Tax=Kwoniella dendrophila CBS 6074 TaxID=1295534 RepID=A0AAX4K1L7_9TREE
MTVKHNDVQEKISPTISISYLETYPFPAFIVLPKPAFHDGPSQSRIIWKNDKWIKWSKNESLETLLEYDTLELFEDWLVSNQDESVFQLNHHHHSQDEFQQELYLVKSVIKSSTTKHDRSNTNIQYVITCFPVKPLISQNSIPTPTSNHYREDTLTPTNIDTENVQIRTPILQDTPIVSPEAYKEPTLLSLDNNDKSHNGQTHEKPNIPAYTPTALSTNPLLSCQALLDSTDWSKTTIGARKEWSPVIEMMMEVILRSPTQDALWLGDDFQMIYNDNYAQIVDHPHMWGRSAMVKEAWGPVWDGVKHLIDRCLEDGEPCYREDDLLLYRRGPKGYWVEKYHTWSFIPLFDENGKPLGLYNPTRDTTASVLARRRQESMRDLSEQLLTARTTTEYFNGIKEVLELNPKDVPFMMCYSIEENSESHSVKLELQSTIGVPDGHKAALNNLELPLGPEKYSRASFGSKANQLSSPTLSAISALSSGTGRVQYSYDRQSWPLAQAIATRQAIVVDDCTDIIKGFELRQWEALPESAIIVPISSETSVETPQAVVIIGLNIASPLDSVYEDWIHVLRAHLTSSLGSVRAAEAEHDRQLERDRMERAKTAWFQGAAHDLRSPLTLVAGPLDDILRTKLTVEQRNGLSLAQRNLARVQRLVNALLDFSRIEAGKLSGRFLPIDLGRFVGDLAALFRPAVERRRIKYVVHVEHHEGMVFVDPTLLETVVTNLISNAVKYTESGTITIELTYHHTYADIAIIDSGIGIPSAELNAVTDRFHRATTALSRGTEGTGIGLALSKEIVRLHGGDLLITSQTAEETQGKRHGSTFTARIPLIERQVVQDNMARTDFGAYGKAVVEEAMHWILPSDMDSESVGSELNESVSSRAEGFLFDRTDILLLVDDNTDMRHYVKNIFSPFCKVIEATNGKKGFEMAKKHQPHLILSDLMMPIMNGQELLTAIRSEPSTRMTPMVLLSAATDDELRLAAFVEGAEDFMLKPFKPKELLARVHLHMQMGKKRAHLEMMYAQRQQELAVILDYCPSGIMRANADGNIIYGNDAYRTYTGIPQDENLNNWSKYVSEDIREDLIEKWNNVLNGNQRETTETWKWSNGTSVSGTFIRLDMIDSKLSGVLGCLSDISYQEEKLLEAERRRIEAEESKQQQELLVDLTSHEIRTPVSAILQCSSLVKENLTSLQSQLKIVNGDGFKATPELLAEIDEDIEALDSIHQCGLVQERIANDILSLARIQLDMLSLHDFESDLKVEAKKLVSVFTSEAKMKKIQLVLEFGENIKKSGISLIKTDHVRLHQVVTNLVSNAIRFTATSTTRIVTVQYEIGFEPPQSENTCSPPLSTKQIQLPVKEDTNVYLYIAIKDTGPGLGAAEQAGLFRRFSQGNKMVHTKFGGSGLGLFICKRISELLGGRIEMESQLGVGSVFRFFIQARTGKPQLSLENSVSKLTLTTPTPTLTPDVNPSGTANTSSGLHLLIVEDNIINQTVLKRQIVKAGFTCDVANHGQEALDYLNEIYNINRKDKTEGRRPYDVILMDLEMPIMDGLTAVKHIRQSESEGLYNRQLVIALTGNARQGQIDQALAAGMDDVVIKPYKLPELFAKVKSKIQLKGDVLPNGPLK